MAITIADIAEAWERVMETTPWDHGDYLLYWLDRKDWPTYRERLDRQPKNYRMHLIPRIAIVRRNFVRLGPIRLDPARLR